MEVIQKLPETKTTTQVQPKIQVNPSTNTKITEVRNSNLNSNSKSKQFEKVLNDKSIEIFHSLCKANGKCEIN
jgi:hypothetical protein